MKILIVLFLFCLPKINCGYTHNLFLSTKKEGKGVFSLSETQFYYIKVRYKVVKITRACFHEKAVLKILPSNLIKEMFSYCPFTSKGIL